ncbi:gp4 [Escherichia phage phiEB49]|uniref:Gp4 n=1 Tax=Escherichia phage phiEB49 TaxID=1048207 RepID=F8UBR4_9CAUD|nr:gp4 [Escherichia phage phiEB49]AEI91204.1 gp4 [Escherichia phage phiEB49]
MATTITKNWVSSDNKLFKARVKFVDEFVNGVVEKVGYEQIKLNGKWVQKPKGGRYINTKTLLCTKVDHSNPLKKSFTEGKRYQIAMHAGLGRNAGYIYDNEGDGWQLTRDDEVGYDVGFGMYKFEAQYK